MASDDLATEIMQAVGAQKIWNEEVTERRKRGTQATVSAIGLGCRGTSHAYGPADESESIATIRLALDQGVTPAQLALAWLLAQSEDMTPPQDARHNPCNLQFIGV